MRAGNFSEANAEWLVKLVSCQTRVLAMMQGHEHLSQPREQGFFRSTQVLVNASDDDAEVGVLTIPGGGSSAERLSFEPSRGHVAGGLLPSNFLD